MAELSYIKLFYDNWLAFDELSMEERGELITAIFAWCMKGLEPEKDKLGAGRYVWEILKLQLKRNADTYSEKAARLRENGMKGGRPAKQKNQMVSEKTKSFEEQEQEQEQVQEQEQEQKSKPGARGREAALEGAVNSFTADEKLREALKEFVKMRESVRSPLTEHALSLLLSDLERLSPDTGQQTEIVNQSVANGWKGFYGLKPPGG